MVNRILPAIVTVSLCTSLALAATANSAAPGAKWKVVDGTKIPVPPAEHPRVYLRAKQVPEIRQRLGHPALKAVVEKLSAKGKPQTRVEWNAVQYLASGDRALGRSTIEECLKLLKACELADKKDACRETGRMMVTGAIVYDWIYSLLTKEEKQAFVRELVRLAKTQECGYPPTRQGSVTGHSSEAMIMRDMVSAGIAIYDEMPEMYDVAAGRIFREHLPVRNWLYNGHAYHQGDSYGVHRFSWDTYPLFIFDRLGAGNVFNPEQRHVPYYWMYVTRPDGQRLREGDTFASSAAPDKPWSEYMGTVLIASYYKDAVLLDRHLTRGGEGRDLIFEFLWRDISLQPKKAEGLPLSRYFGSPFGWMVARTGWGDDAVVARMKVNEYNFVNHQHLDAGDFQIYYRGTLAADSGLYSGSSGQYSSDHCRNYYWRTIAHNSLLIHDPQEDFDQGRKPGRGGHGNDGGQRLPNGRSEARDLSVLLAPEKGYRTGQVLAHGFGPGAKTPDYTILSGDITAAYSKKVRQVVRTSVFLNLRNSQVPAAMMVFDRVVSADAGFKKYWLLHSLEEPKIEAAGATVDCSMRGASGRLNLDVLWPAAENLEVSKVGGPGKEYWVFGTNYANDVPAAQVERSTIEPAGWRIEVSAKKASAEDLFVNVMQVTDRTKPARWPVKRVETTTHVGGTIEGPQGTWMVLMRKDAARSGERVTFSVAPGKATRVLVGNLEKGKWVARSGGKSQTIDVAEASGTAWIEAGGGEWTLARQGR